MIRKMRLQDKEEVVEMMRGFYTSPAVHTNGSEEIYLADVENCINDCPYLEGFVFEEKGNIQGYGMIAKSFSTEFGKPCIWIEDLFIKEEYRKKGISRDFFEMLKNRYPNHLLRIEAEEENERAVSVYKKAGFQILPYLELYKE
mgnify:CR=1 FL=1